MPILIILHIVLFCLSVIVLGIAIWSRFNNPQWNWKSYALLALSLGYVGGTFIVNYGVIEQRGAAGQVVITYDGK